MNQLKLKLIILKLLNKFLILKYTILIFFYFIISDQNFNIKVFNFFILFLIFLIIAFYYIVFTNQLLNQKTK